MREEISIALVRGRSCRFLEANGRLTPGRSCATPVVLHAVGASSWSLRIRGRLPKGRYRLVARAVDASGNRELPGKHNERNFRIR